MTAAGIELYSNILTSRRAEHPLHLPHTLAHGAHRVPVAGQEVDRGIPVHFGQVVPVGDELKAAHHVPEHGRRDQKAAQRVSQVGVHRRLVPAEPVGGGAVGLEGPVVAAKGQVV